MRVIIYIFLCTICCVSGKETSASGVNDSVSDISVKISEEKQGKQKPSFLDGKTVLRESQEDKSEEDVDDDDIEFVPVTVEHPLFKVFGINPTDYLIFYKHRKAKIGSNQQFSLDPTEQQQYHNELKITKKRADTEEQQVEGGSLNCDGHSAPCSGNIKTDFSSHHNQPLLFALMPFGDAHALGHIFSGVKSNILASKLGHVEEKVPYMTAQELAGDKPAPLNFVGTGVYPVE